MMNMYTYLRSFKNLLRIKIKRSTVVGVSIAIRCFFNNLKRKSLYCHLRLMTIIERTRFLGDTAQRNHNVDHGSI